MAHSVTDNLRMYVRENSLLNLRWYETASKEKFEGLEAAIDHYVSVGIRREISPNALFSPGHYLTVHRERVPQGMPSFEHYFLQGMSEGLSPHPIIDVGWVLRQLEELGIDEPILKVLLHKCSALSIDPHPCFSVRFYLQRYPELAARRVHPIIHFIEHGIRERRSPHPLFWMKWLRTQNELKPANDNIFFAYLLGAKYDHISPNPFFDGRLYLDTHVDVKTAGLNPLYHYLRFGRFEQRTPNPSLDMAFFAEKYGSQLKITRLDPLSFLLLYGNGHVIADRAGSPLKLANEKFRIGIEDALREQFSETLEARVRNRKLLYVTHNLRFQGAQNSLFELSKGIKHFGSYDVMALAPDSGPLLGAYRAAGIPVHGYKLPVAGLTDPKDYDRLWRGFKDQIRSLNPDIIHGNTIQSYHAVAAASELNVASVWNIRESEPPKSHFDNLTIPAQQKLQQAIDCHGRIVFVSRTTKELWEKTFPDIRSTVVHNGIDYTRLVAAATGVSRALGRHSFRITEGDTVFINVGTWTDRKGQLDIVQALKYVDRRLWKNLSVILIGANDSSYGRLVRNEIKALPCALRERVHVVEETRSGYERGLVIACLLASDVFIMSSRIESYPRVVNEALYFGLAVITTPCFGVIEQVTDGREGLYYPAGSPDLLAKRIEVLSQGKRQLLRMAGEARQTAMSRVKQYGEMLREYRAVYENL
jgi:glycosyltransferase involved in cell wall biosynthesis